MRKKPQSLRRIDLGQFLPDQAFDPLRFERIRHPFCFRQGFLKQDCRLCPRNPGSLREQEKGVCPSLWKFSRNAVRPALRLFPIHRRPLEDHLLKRHTLEPWVLQFLYLGRNLICPEFFLPRENLGSSSRDPGESVRLELGRGDGLRSFPGFSNQVPGSILISGSMSEVRQGQRS